MSHQSEGEREKESKGERFQFTAEKVTLLLTFLSTLKKSEYYKSQAHGIEVEGEVVEIVVEVEAIVQCNNYSVETMCTSSHHKVELLYAQQIHLQFIFVYWRHVITMDLHYNEALSCMASSAPTIAWMPMN